MRKQCEAVLKECFRANLIQTREKTGLTQESMAHQLLMSVRNYCALESGDSCCGAVTLSIYLVFVCEDSGKFLKELYHGMVAAVYAVV